MRDFTTSVPPEVRSIILTHLYSSALEHVRLVDKQWSAVAATLLWRHLRVDISLYDADRPRFNALLSSSPNGIMDNVKELSIFASRTRPSHVQKEQTTSVLLRLLSVLPQDKLMTFHSGTLPVHPDVICVLLRTQSQLREVAMLVDERNLDGLPEGIHVRNNLSQMEKITFDVAGVQHQTYRSAGVWLVHTPKLHDLTIKGRDSGLNAFKGWIPPIHSNLVKLRRLAIHDVYLKDLPIGITKNLQLPSLEHLSLRECSNAAPFLLSLAQKFKQTDNPALESFEHCGVSVQEDAQEACAKLIESVNGLKDITVGVMTGAVLDLQCLGSNSTSLRRLDLVCDDDDIEYYSAEDLVQLKFLCPALEWLSVNLGHLSSVFDDVALSEAFVLAEHREYVQKLEAIAQHSGLHSLQIADTPLLRGEYTSNERRFLYTEVASKLFQQLAHDGSSVKRLYFNPGMSGYDTEADEDGHAWPLYAFERGIVLVNRDGRQNTIKTIAVPDPQHAAEIFQRTLS